MNGGSISSDFSNIKSQIHLLASGEDDESEILSYNSNYNSRSVDRKVRFSENNDIASSLANDVTEFHKEEKVDELFATYETNDDPSLNSAHASLSLDSTLPSNSPIPTKSIYPLKNNNSSTNGIFLKMDISELIEEDASNEMAVVALTETEGSGTEKVSPIPFAIERKTSGTNKIIPWYRQRRNQATIIGIFVTVMVVLVLFYLLIIAPSSNENSHNDPILDNCETICSLPRSNCDDVLVCRYIDKEKEDRYPCKEFLEMPSICSLVFSCTSASPDKCS